MQPVLDVRGVMVGGSQVPNLLEPNAASTLVVSQDVDLVVPVDSHDEVREVLSHVSGYEPSTTEPSVWLPDDPVCLEINFIGRDPKLRESADSYVLDDARLPLLVFGLLGFLREGMTVETEGVRVRLPRPAGLLVEKLLTERTGLKGERDLLVALGLLLHSGAADLTEFAKLYEELPHDSQTLLLSSLAVLSRLRPQSGMPDPEHGRERVDELLARLQSMP